MSKADAQTRSETVLSEEEEPENSESQSETETESETKSADEQTTTGEIPRQKATAKSKRKAKGLKSQDKFVLLLEQIEQTGAGEKNRKPERKNEKQIN